MNSSMMRKLLLALLLLALFVLLLQYSPLTFGQHAGETIQKQIDALPRSGGSVPVLVEHGTTGGTIQLPAGTILLSAPLRVTSGVTLRGHGKTATVFFQKKPGEAAILLTDGGSGNGPFNITFADFGVKSAGPAFLLPPVQQGEPDSLRFENLLVDAPGAIDLRQNRQDHVSYRVVLRNVDFANPGPFCFAGPVRMAEFDRVRVQGPWRSGFVHPAMIDVTGSNPTGIMRNCWLEGEYPNAFLRLTSTWFTGTWAMQNVWNEPGWADNPHPQYLFSAFRVIADQTVAQDFAGVSLQKGSTLASDVIRATDVFGATIDLTRVYNVSADSQLLLSATTKPTAATKPVPPAER